MVIKQYHDFLGHMTLDKSYHTMRHTYYFPNMYKKLYTYIDQCVICQTRSSKTPKPPLQDTDIPPYPFAKIASDLSGPYPETLSGNKYIVSFIDVFTGWPEAFSVPYKCADISYSCFWKKFSQGMDVHLRSSLIMHLRM